MISIGEAARRGIELALDEAVDQLNEALTDEEDEETWIVRLAEVTRLEQMLEVM